jgi:Fe(3+) dicitrate transport protein
LKGIKYRNPEPKTGIGYRGLLEVFNIHYLSTQFTDATNAPQDINDNQRGMKGQCSL